MKLAALALAAVVVSGVSIAAEQAAPQRTAADDARVLTVDTPLSVLIDDARTAPVLQKRLPQVVERLRTDEAFRQVFGDSTLRDLTIDPHVRGFTESALASLNKELAEAQKAPD